MKTSGKMLFGLIVGLLVAAALRAVLHLRGTRQESSLFAALGSAGLALGAVTS